VFCLQMALLKGPAKLENIVRETCQRNMITRRNISRVNEKVTIAGSEKLNVLLSRWQIGDKGSCERIIINWLPKKSGELLFSFQGLFSHKL